MPGEYGWKGYLRSLAAGSSEDATAARICLEMGGKRPCDTRRNTQSALRGGKIDEATYRFRIDILDRLSDMYSTKRVAGFVDTSDARDWQPLPNGGHMRVAHREYLDDDEVIGERVDGRKIYKPLDPNEA